MAPRQDGRRRQSVQCYQSGAQDRDAVDRRSAVHQHCRATRNRSISPTVITDLSKIAGLLVISRNSSFTYKGRSVDVRAVGRDLGVAWQAQDP